MITALFTGITMIISLIVSMIVTIAMWLIPAIALYRMAKYEGRPYAWLAFIPFARCYQEITIPNGEYNLFNWIRTQDRKKVAIIYIIVGVAGTAIASALAAVPVVGQLLAIAYAIAVNIMMWKKRYDLIANYESRETALVISIIDIFIPVVYEIYVFILSLKLPKRV